MVSDDTAASGDAPPNEPGDGEKYGEGTRDPDEKTPADEAEALADPDANHLDIDVDEIDLHDEVERVDRESVSRYPDNPKSHPAEQVASIASSITNYGWDQPIVVDEDDVIIKGHGRLSAAERLDLDEVPIIRRTDLSDDEKRAARIADNRVSESPWEMSLLGEELDALFEADDFDAEYDTGFDDDDLDQMFEDPDTLGTDEETVPVDSFESDDVSSPEPDSGSTSSSSSSTGSSTNVGSSSSSGSATSGPIEIEPYFAVRPASVLATDDEAFETRREEFADAGVPTPDMSGLAPGLSQASTVGEPLDPALANLVYQWYAPDADEASVLDPFATSGGATAGYVAAITGLDYEGYSPFSPFPDGQEPTSTRSEWSSIRDGLDAAERSYVDPTWSDETAAGEDVDLVFGAPPTTDLEEYEAAGVVATDVSTKDLRDDLLVDSYRDAVDDALDHLADDRFAVFLVGDSRDAAGYPRDLPRETVRAAADEHDDVSLYDEATVVDPPPETGRETFAFRTDRRLARTHRSLLVFYKGDRAASNSIGGVDVDALADLDREANDADTDTE